MRSRGKRYDWALAAARRLAVPAMLLGMLSGGCAGPGSGPEAGGSVSARSPHVVFVLVDALRADRLGVNGYRYPTTPNLDAVAADGINFTAFYSHSTWTKPSIATLFTSLYPTQHGVGTAAKETAGGMVTDVLADDLVTLAERFQGAGYATIGVVNQVHLQARFGFAQGFDLYRPRRGTSALRINTVLRRWLDRRGQAEERPVFAYLHYLDAHFPYTRRSSGEPDRFGSLEMSSPPPASGAAVRGWVAGGISDPDLAGLEARYDHEVAYVDEAIGDLVALLSEQGLYEETLLVVTSDHGEAFLERGLLQHSYDPFDELVRIPLVIRLPGSGGSRGSTVTEPSGLIDLVPTLLELAGLEPEPQAQGRSLVPWIEGAGATQRVVFMEHQGRRTARSPRWKLMERATGARELYDLQSDPGETAPLAGPCGGDCESLRRQLDNFVGYLEETSRPGGALESLAADDLEELEALGYL